MSALGSLSDDLESMAAQAAGTQGGGLAANIAQEAAGHAKSLSSYLDGREPGELLDDARDFARRRPGAFLFGALAAGVIVGRVVRGVKDAPATSAPRQQSSSTPLPPSTPPSSVAPGLASPPTALPGHDAAGTATGQAPLPGYATQPPTSAPLPGPAGSPS